MTANEGQIGYWNEIGGAKWVANRAKLDRIMTPLSEAVIAMAAPEPGERVLDVGCGCGALTLDVAEEVGPGGNVLAVDVSKPMLAHARDRAAAQTGLAPIDWVEADAMLHAFSGDRDLMVSRFGVMFFEDRGRAFANLRKALRPGGRFVFLTWRSCAECEWLQRPLDWIAPVIPVDDQGVDEIGPFSLFDPAITRRALEGAGFREVVATPLDRRLALGSADEALALFADAGPAAKLMREAEPAARAEALRRLDHALAELDTGAGVTLGSACWLYSGVA